MDRLRLTPHLSQQSKSRMLPVTEPPFLRPVTLVTTKRKRPNRQTCDPRSQHVVCLLQLDPRHQSLSTQQCDHEAHLVDRLSRESISNDRLHESLRSLGFRLELKAQTLTRQPLVLTTVDLVGSFDNIYVTSAMSLPTTVNMTMR
jgi:hypothetical protein